MRLVVKVIWIDFVLFTFTLHCSSHVCKTLRCSWSLSGARLGLVSEDSIAVSSAKVAIKVSSVVGMSDVKMRYSKGPRNPKLKI